MGPAKRQARRIMGTTGKNLAHRAVRQDEDRGDLRSAYERLSCRLRRGPLPVRASSYRGKRRSPTTGNPEWSKTSKDRSEILTWLGAGEKAKPRWPSAPSRGAPSRRPGRVDRRRRGRSDPTPAPRQARALRSDDGPGLPSRISRLLDPEFGERLRTASTNANGRRSSTSAAREGLSYSRLANAKAVASSIYAWALHRTRRHVDARTLSATSTSAPTSASAATRRARGGGRASRAHQRRGPGALRDRASTAVCAAARSSASTGSTSRWRMTSPAYWLRVAPARASPARAATADRRAAARDSLRAYHARAPVVRPSRR